MSPAAVGPGVAGPGPGEARSGPVRIPDLARWKAAGQRFAMVTAYDYTAARLLDAAGVPVLLVGDTLGMVVLGYPTTIPVTLEEMLHHSRAVARGAGQALLVGDLPFLTYHGGLDDATRNAGRLLQAGMASVKLEGGGPALEVVAHLTARGIPVMGHLGLTPQSEHALGGMRVQGRGEEAARRLADDLRGLAQAGAFAVVLEGIPGPLGADLTAATPLPTIGIGAGPGCDGQVLVFHDLLGLTVGRVPKFVKRYAELGRAVQDAARAFQAEVASGTYPDAGHSYR
ncbi:MAG TPA: 3-methyl-2-oxobutanoate hydroxymethyltransferase [Candidatus Dormibacteraeota bacterium]|nr:3-methyl-2-oxobutanoate hydroxymethyltransferase [Candidatus Dormibacteraeota bacterium]